MEIKVVFILVCLYLEDIVYSLFFVEWDEDFNLFGGVFDGIYIKMDMLIICGDVNVVCGNFVIFGEFVVLILDIDYVVYENLVEWIGGVNIYFCFLIGGVL